MRDCRCTRKCSSCDVGIGKLPVPLDRLAPMDPDVDYVKKFWLCVAVKKLTEYFMVA